MNYKATIVTYYVDPKKTSYEVVYEHSKLSIVTHFALNHLNIFPTISAYAELDGYDVDKLGDSSLHRNEGWVFNPASKVEVIIKKGNTLIMVLERFAD